MDDERVASGMPGTTEEEVGLLPGDLSTEADSPGTSAELPRESGLWSDDARDDVAASRCPPATVFDAREPDAAGIERKSGELDALYGTMC